MSQITDAVFRNQKSFNTVSVNYALYQTNIDNNLIMIFLTLAVQSFNVESFARYLAYWLPARKLSEKQLDHQLLKQ